MSHKFGSLGEGIGFFRKQGYAVHKLTPHVYSIEPSEIPEGYPIIPETGGIPKCVGALFCDGSYFHYNGSHGIIWEHHRRIDKQLIT